MERKKYGFRQSFRWLAGFCMMVALFLGMPAAVKASQVSANGWLHVKGNKVVNEKGKPFVIKGVSTHGLSWYPQYVNKKAFKTLRD